MIIAAAVPGAALAPAIAAGATAVPPADWLAIFAATQIGIGAGAAPPPLTPGDNFEPVVTLDAATADGSDAPPGPLAEVLPIVPPPPHAPEVTTGAVVAAAGEAKAIEAGLEIATGDETAPDEAADLVVQPGLLLAALSPAPGRPLDIKITAPPPADPQILAAAARVPLAPAGRTERHGVSLPDASAVAAPPPTTRDADAAVTSRTAVMPVTAAASPSETAAPAAPVAAPASPGEAPSKSVVAAPASAPLAATTAPSAIAASPLATAPLQPARALAPPPGAAPPPVRSTTSALAQASTRADPARRGAPAADGLALAATFEADTRLAGASDPALFPMAAQSGPSTPAATSASAAIATDARQLFADSPLAPPIAMTGDAMIVATDRLGAVRVAIDAADGLAVALSVDRGAAAALLSAAVDRLDIALAASGQRLEALSVDVRGESGGHRPPPPPPAVTPPAQLTANPTPPARPRRDRYA